MWVFDVFEQKILVKDYKPLIIPYMVKSRVYFNNLFLYTQKLTFTNNSLKIRKYMI